MINPSPYLDEPSRIAALMRYRDLDYSSNSEFQTIAQLAAEICDAPICVITFVDENEVTLLFSHGIEGVSCVPNDIAFCTKTASLSDMLEIPDTRLDPEFKNSPLVIEDPKILSYTGMPLITYDGYTIGTLCVMSQQPKKLSSAQINSLTQFSKIVIKLFESKLIESLSRTNESFIQAIDEIVYDHDITGKKIKWSGAYTRILGFNIEEMGTNEESWLRRVHPDDLPAVLEELEAIKTERHLYDLEYRFTHRNGNYLWIHDRGVMHFDEDGQAKHLVGIMRDVSKRKLIEAEKRAQESHSRLFFNHAPVCIHGIDLQGCFTSMNPSGLKMVDLESEKQIKGIPYLRDVAKKDYDRIKLLLEKALQGENSTFEFTGTSGNIYSSCFVPIKNDQNTVIKLMGISEDITERKHSEQDLRDHNIALSHSLPGIARLNKSGRYLYVNEIYAELLGYTPDELIGQSWKMTVAPRDIKTGIHAYKRMLEEDKVEFDLKSIRKDGSPIFKHVLIVKHVGDNGDFIGLNCFIKNITEQKNAEQNLREMNIALSHSLPGIARIEPNGCYCYVNEIYAGLLGYTPDELIGQSWKVTVDPEHIEIGEHGYQRMLEEDNVEFDIKGIRKDGAPIFKHVLIVKRVDDNGYFIGHHCFMKDITERVEAENKHKELQNELNHVARLSNMDEMATGLAHEINQPLTAISHYCDAAQTLLASEPTAGYKLCEILQSTSEQAYRAGEIVRHYRQFASKQPMEKCIVNLNELTQETVRFLDADLHDRNASIQITLDEKLPAVEIDKVQIQQVLVNLIRNGLEAMENNNGAVRKLTVCTHLNGKNGNKPEVQVTVKDTGHGLELPQIDNLFQPFYTTKTSGMGMGLSISRSIIDAHGGKIWLDTQHQQETQFHFTLPIDTK